MSPKLDQATAEAFVRQHFDAMATGTLDDFSEIVHPDGFNREAIIEPPACRGRGPEAWYATALWLRHMAPDVHWDIHEVVYREDLIAAHCTMRGQQTGENVHYDGEGNVMQVMPASGRAFAVNQSHWLRMQDGKVIEHWANRDDLGMGLQLGWF